ncbi:Pentatricopeptide repeat [Cinnamomum micranthum f. kanehirae]|uniref:Pentatricopeptide repeat n=1 Tax=Cinnamomum micranthum f. kanehirae TaxID=337451 RepID=A0A3S3N412_9MAGN|nr:Pentatricopeptide repeat [Cinnamomum micranthum f. kanehirae]
MICTSVSRFNLYRCFFKKIFLLQPHSPKSQLFKYPSLISPYSSKPRSQFTRSRSKSKAQAQALAAAAQDLFQQSLSQLPPRFTTQDLYKALSLQRDPNACLLLFNWASQQPRFRHDVSTFLIIIKKLGAAQLLDEFDAIVSQALSLSVTSETLFNTIIYFYTESRKLSKAVSVYKHMKKCKDPNCRPSVRTYNLLFSAMLSRGTNSYINYMYMETIRCLFKQMVDDGLEPDVFSLNAMIKGYVLSLHVNDALRIFHQMGAVYKCLPNAFSYDYLVHGLCAQGRSMNAQELYGEMKSKGFVPSRKAYNSLVNCLAIGGEVDEAVRILWEMEEMKRVVDSITYQTVVDALGRQGRVEEAVRLLRKLREKDMLDGHLYGKLMHLLQDDFGGSDGRNGFGERQQEETGEGGCYIASLKQMPSELFQAINRNLVKTSFISSNRLPSPVPSEEHDDDGDGDSHNEVSSSAVGSAKKYWSF